MFTEPMDDQKDDLQFNQSHKHLLHSLFTGKEKLYRG
jgi:hypothetical protein